MAERNYQGFQLAQGGSVMPQTGAPLRAPRVAPDVQPSPVAAALDGLLAFGEQFAKQNVARVAEESYIDGVRQATLGQSLEEMETDPLTKPFVRGGYNMQNYRIEQATLAREIQDFIATEGKAMEPEEFARYLAEQSSQRFPDLGAGLSQPDRARAIAAQAQLEQNLVEGQAKAYKQYAIEQAAQRFTIQGNQINGAMTKAKNSGDSEAYIQNAERAALFVNDLLTSDSLPSGMRAETATQYLQSLLAVDHADLVEDIRDAGMLDELPHDARVKIDNGIRESKARTRARDSIGVLESNGQFMASLAEGKVGIDDVRAYVDREVQAQRLSIDEAESIYEKFFKSQSDKDTLADMISAVTGGDINRLHQLGFSVDEALLKLDQNWAINGVPLEQRTMKGIQLGMRLGVIPRQFGQQVANAVGAVAANPDELNPSQVNFLNTIMSTVKQNEAVNPAAAQVLLDSVPEAQRNVVAYAIRAADNGIAPVDAIKMATARTEEFQAMEGIRQRRTTAEFQETVGVVLDKEFGNTWYQKLGRFVSGDARPSQDVWNQSQLKMHVQSEIRRLAEDPKNIALFSQDEDSQEALVELAVSNVRNRTLTVGVDGRFSGAAETALVLPRGATVKGLFGTGNVDEVGRQLALAFPAEADDYATGFRYDPVFGRLLNVQIDESGRVVKETPVDAKEIGRRVEAERQRITNEARAANFGMNLEVQAESGPVNFYLDGNNTAGVGRRAVLRWRQNLVEQEGLRLSAYKDTTGNTTIGAGEKVQGEMEVGETIEVAEAEALFQTSTDDALNAAVRISKSLGVQSDRATLAIAGAVYQLGERGLSEFQKTAEAIRNQDYDAFVENVKDSDWYRQTPSRVEYFIQEMQSHFEY